MRSEQIRPPGPEERPQLAAWLDEAGLVADELENLHPLLVLTRGGRIAVMGGVERHGSLGILRSVLTLPDFRRKGLAARLVRALHEQARQAGLRRLYLITEDAAGFFSRLGYEPLGLEQAPEPVRRFRHRQCRCAPCAQAMVIQLQ